MPSQREEIFGARVTLVFGEFGSGKTRLLLEHPDRAEARYLDLEDRYPDLVRVWTEQGILDEDVEIDFVVCRVQDENHDDDDVATWKKVEAEIHRAIHDGVKVLVIDGVGDLRDMSAAEWEARKKHKPGGSPGNWAQINGQVRQVMLRAYNYARAFRHKGVRVVASVLLYEEKNYETGAYTGKMIHDLRKIPELVQRADGTIFLCRENDTDFMVRREKSPYGPTGWKHLLLEE